MNPPNSSPADEQRLREQSVDESLEDFLEGQPVFNNDESYVPPVLTPEDFQKLHSPQVPSKGKATEQQQTHVEQKEGRLAIRIELQGGDLQCFTELRSYIDQNFSAEVSFPTDDEILRAMVQSLPQDQFEKILDKLLRTHHK